MTRPVGRPRSCECGECPRCKAREKARARYQAKSKEERRAVYEKQDKERARQRDRERYRNDPVRRETTLARSREYIDADRGRRNEVARAWGHANREKTRAQNRARRALKKGLIERGPCERLEEGGCTGMAQMHHDDYEKPLEVRWLCPRHHGAVHVELRDAGHEEGQPEEVR